MTLDPQALQKIQSTVEAFARTDPKGLASWIAGLFRSDPAPSSDAPMPATGKGYAFVVGIDRVDARAYGGWDGALASCVNDAKAMRALCGRLGYDSIEWLYNEAATRGEVANHIRFLAAKAMPGDTVLIFQSRHGGRVPGYDGPGDDWIETHCLYDGQMLDDEFRGLLAMFPAGVTIPVIFDACYAEGSTKAGPPSSVGFRGKSMPDAVVELAYRAQRVVYEAAKAVARPAEIEVVADVIEMAACSKDEFSYAGEPNSEYTRCLLDACEDFRGDYHKLHVEVVRRIRTNQHPKLTGPPRALDRPALRP